MPAGATTPAGGETSQDAAPAAAAPRSSTTKETHPLSEDIYRSSNGDRWQLIRDGFGRRFVRHEANAAAGGQVTETDVDEFLSVYGSSPQSVALRRALTKQVHGE